MWKVSHNIRFQINRFYYWKWWHQTSLVIQWLRLCTFTAEGTGSIPGPGTKIPQAVWCGQGKKVITPIIKTWQWLGMTKTNLSNEWNRDEFFLKSSHVCQDMDKMVGWHYWLNGHEFEQALEDGEGQGSLACMASIGLQSRTWLNSRVGLNNRSAK